MPGHRVDRLAAPEVRALAAAGAPALWAIGSTEQHGTHLVTGFDARSAEAVCERAAALVDDDVALLPPLPFGASDHWLPLGATWSLRASTLVDVLVDVARSAGASGFTRLVIVNGHAGNIGPALTALALAGSDVTVEFVSYWTLVDAEAVRAQSPSDHGGVGHAGEVETSIALHLGDGLAVADRLPAPAGKSLDEGPGSADPVARLPRPEVESPSGVYGDPRTAHAALGALVVEQAAARLAERLRR